MSSEFWNPLSYHNLGKTTDTLSYNATHMNIQNNLLILFAHNLLPFTDVWLLHESEELLGGGDGGLYWPSLQNHNWKMLWASCSNMRNWDF